MHPLSRIDCSRCGRWLAAEAFVHGTTLPLIPSAPPKCARGPATASSSDRDLLLSDVETPKMTDVIYSAFLRDTGRSAMSHFTTVKTQMMVAEYIKKSLEDVGYPYEEGAVRIRGYGGRKTKVEIKISTSSTGYDIGLRPGKTGYEIVADWWGIKDIDQKVFIQQLTQRYAYHAAMDKLQKQGFDLSSEEVGADGKIHLVLRRMA